MTDQGEPMNHIWAGDAVSLATIAGAFFGLLPYVATVLGVVWYTMMILDWIEARRLKKAAVAAEGLLETARKAAKELKEDTDE
jgi:hypothetical protein